MAGSHRAGNTSRPSWRTAAEKTSDGSIWVQRFVVTLFGLALLALFVWLLVWYFLSRSASVHFVTLQISDYGQLDAPPIAFAEEDHAALEAAAPLPHATYLHRIDDTESENALARLKETCNALSAGNVLVIYITAHGVTDGKQAWLLASNYSPGKQSTQGRIAVKDVLNTIQAAPAQRKIVVLDCGQLEQELAQGMLVNDFCLQVEQEVKALTPGKQTLYVMLPNQFLEQSQLAYREQRTPFNYFFVQGWQGAADSATKPDKQLSLAEWFTFTRDRTANWVWNASGQSSQQTPLLLRAGVGRVEPSDAQDFVLRNIPETKVADAKQEAFPPDEKQLEKKVSRRWRSMQSGFALAQAPPGESTEQKATPTPMAEPLPPAPPMTPPAAPVADEAKEPPAQDDDASTWLLSLMHSDRNSLQGYFARPQYRPWTTADYAPYQWRELSAWAMSLEREALVSSRTEAAKTRLLREQLQHNTTTKERALALLEGCATAWQQSPGVKQLDALPDLLAAVTARDAATLRLYELMQLGTLRPADGWPASHQHHLELLRKETLAIDQALAGPLDRDANGRLVSVADSSVPLGERAQKLKALLDEVTSSTVAPASDSRLQNPLLPELLACSLLSDAQRRDARAAWLARLAKVPAFEDAELKGPSANQTQTWRTNRAMQLRQRAGVELTYGQTLAAFLPPAASSDLAECAGLESKVLDEVQLPQLNQCGRTLAALRRQIAAQVNDYAASTSSDQTAQVESLIRLASDIPTSSVVPAWMRVIKERRYTLPTEKKQLAIHGPQVSGETTPGVPIALSPSGGKFTWQLGPAELLLPDTVLVVEYDEKLLQVDVPGGKTLTSRGSITIPKGSLTGDAVAPIELRITPKSGEDTGKQATLSFRDVSTKQVLNVTSFQLPEPKWLDVFVRAWSGGVADLTSTPSADAEGLYTWQLPVGSDGHSKALLQPFPSGSSPFALRIGNRSQKERVLKYRVWTISADSKSPRTRDWQPWEPSGELKRSAVLLSESEMKVPAAGELDLSLFPTPPAPLPAAPGAPAAPAAPLATPAPLHVERGIVCEFVASDGVAPQRLWLDVAPLHPAEYIDVTFTPNINQRSLAAKLALMENGPRRVGTHDCEVRWERLDTADPLKPAGLADKGNLLQRPLTISERLPAGQDRTNVVLSIDGYPRALEYTAPLFGKAERIQAGREYLRFVLLTTDKENKPVLITDRNRYFPTLDKIDFWAMADVPQPHATSDTYEFRVYVAQAGDAGGQGEDTSRQFLADRTTDVELLKAEAATPRFLLRAKVDDLRGELKLAGLTNRVVTVRAEILKRDREGHPVGAPLVREDRLVIDNEAPELNSQPREQTITIGEPLKLAVKINDRVAGVRDVLWSFQLDPQGNLKMPETVEVRSLSATDTSDTRAAEANLELDTKEWTPGTRKLRLQAFDKAGNSNADPWEIPLKVVAPVGEPMAMKKEKNSLLVYVKRDGKGERGIAVSISGPESRSGTTDGSGLVKFDDLPPGDYSVMTTKVEVIVKNKLYIAETVKANLAAPPKPAAEAVLNLR